MTSAPRAATTARCRRTQFPLSWEDSSSGANPTFQKDFVDCSKGRFAAFRGRRVGLFFFFARGASGASRQTWLLRPALISLPRGRRRPGNRQPRRADGPAGPLLPDVAGAGPILPGGPEDARLPARAAAGVKKEAQDFSWAFLLLSGENPSSC